MFSCFRGYGDGAEDGVAPEKPITRFSQHAYSGIIARVQNLVVNPGNTTKLQMPCYDGARMGLYSIIDFLCKRNC